MIRWCILSSLFPAIAVGQWEQLYPDVPWPQQGTPSGKEVLMTSVERGFLLRKVYYSPSSGSGYTIYHTDDDWDESPADYVTGSGGGVGCCYARFLDFTPAGALVYERFDSGLLDFYRLSIEADVASHQELGFPPTSVFEVCAANDSLFYALRNNLDGSVDILKSEDDEYDELAIVQDSGLTRDLDFLDAERGCLLTRQSSGASRIRVSTDGGFTWSDPYVTESRLNKVLWSEGEGLWAVGDSGLVVHSSDSGQVWSVVPPPTPLNLHSVASYSSDSLWVGGEAGLVLTTGDAGTTWRAFPVGDTTIIRIQTFPNAVYAYPATGLVFKFIPPTEDLSRAGTGTWWSYAADGVMLRLDNDETIVGLSLYDVEGRSVNARSDGGRVILQNLRGGLYVMDLATSKRQERGKILWVPFEK